MAMTTAQVDIIRCGRARFNDRNFSVAYYSELFASLHFYEYSGDLRIDDISYDIVPGDISFTPLKATSQYNVHAQGVHYYIHMGPGLSPWLKEQRKPIVYRSGIEQRHYRERFQLVQKYLSIVNNPAARTAAGLVVQEILLRLNLEDEQVFPADQDPVRLASRYLEQNLETEISIPEIADEVKISPNYLAVKFREEYGMTMKQYLVKRRIETAKFLLSSTGLTVVSIGKRVGIPDPQYFNKVFRREVGVSPSTYREGAATKNET